MQHISLQDCSKRGFSICANSAAMDKGLREDQRLIQELVEWSGLRPSRIAREANVAATTITRPFNGAADSRISRPTIEKLKARFPGFPKWGGDEVVVDAGDPRLEKYGDKPLPPVPVLGSAIGVRSFDPERHIELTDIDADEVLDHVSRPQSLVSDTKAYAVTIVGDSMWPRFRPGRRVIVSPRAPVSIGDDVIVQLRGESGASEDRVSSVLIKELVRRSASYIELRQFNPDVTFQVPSAQVVSIHKVIGEVY